MAGKLSEAAAGNPMTPQLADAAAQAGAPPPPQAEAPQPTSAPPPQPATAQVQPGAQPAPQAGMDGPAMPEEPATPEEQAEYDRAMSALARVLYGNDNTANSIVDQVDPNDKVGSTAKVTMLLMRELDRKIDMAEVTVAPITQEAVGRVAELAEARHGIQYNPAEMEQTLGAAWEGVAAMFGSEGGQEGAQAFQQFVSSFDAGTLEQIQSQYEAALNG